MFRLPPLMAPQYYKSYSIRSPLATHWRPATCEEYECDEYLFGFELIIDLSTELGQRQYHYVTHDTSRRCTEERLSLTMTRFTYLPGNQCFKFGDHRVPVGRPSLYVCTGGDWRGNPRGEN